MAETPSKPSPTTNMPLTVPAPKATFKAGFRPNTAFLAVLTLALTAIHMPKYPMMAEKVPPKTKVAATPVPKVRAITTASTNMMGMTTLNWRAR